MEAFERGEDLFRRRHDVIRMLGVCGEHRELVTTEPRDRVSRAQYAPQPSRDLLQEAVAAVVSQRVVDVFEAVEVEQQHAEHLLVAARRQQGLPQTVAEQAPVGQPGQCVVQGLVLERVGVGLALGDVAEGGDEQVPRADLHRADDELERKKASVLSLAHGLVGAADRDVELESPLEIVDERAAMRRRDQDVGLLPD